MTACPDCGGKLGDGAFKCKCGWKGSTPQQTSPAVSVNYADIERERARHMRWLEAGSPTAEQSIAKMKAIVRKPRPTVREHWEKVLNTPGAPYIAVEYAKEYLARKTKPQAERVPGEDDETFRHAAEFV